MICSRFPVVRGPSDSPCAARSAAVSVDIRFSQNPIKLGGCDLHFERRERGGEDQGEKEMFRSHVYTFS
jgi:hypothetical protein